MKIGLTSPNIAAQLSISEAKPSDEAMNDSDEAMNEQTVERFRLALLEVESEKRKKGFDDRVAEAAVILYDLQPNVVNELQLSAAAHDHINRRMFHYLAHKYLAN